MAASIAQAAPADPAPEPAPAPAMQTPQASPSRKSAPKSAPGPRSAGSPFHERLYEQARLLQAKKDRATLDAARSLTFTPKINKHRRRGGAGGGRGMPSSASARLYQDAVLQRKRRADQREAIERASQPTFSPTITAKGHCVRREGGEDVGTRLFRTAAEHQKHRERRAKEQATKECPFRPAVNRRRPKTASSGRTAFERLYDPSSTRRRNDPAHNLGGEANDVKERESARAARSEHPAAAGASPEAAGERLHARWSASLQRRAELRARTERSETEGLTFQPSMSAWSRRWADGAPAGVAPAYERLFVAAAERQERLAEAVRQKREAELKGLTFRPEVGEVSRTLVAEAEREAAEEGAGPQGDAFSRLYEEGLVRQQQRALDKFNAAGDVAPDRDPAARRVPRPGDVPVHERLYQNARVRRAGRAGGWDEIVAEELRGAEELLAGAREGVEGAERRETATSPDEEGGLFLL